MGHDKFQNRCDDETSRDMNHESGNHLNFPIVFATNEFSSKCEHDVDLEDNQEEDGDNGDTFDMWDITTEDVERIRDEILNVTMDDEEADFNPTKDLEELEILLAKEPQSNFKEIRVGTLYLLEVFLAATQVVVLGYLTSCEDASQTGLVGCYIGGR
ncbi:hypothetical protein Tco_0052049 [Tanacetum coccineum]